MTVRRTVYSIRGKPRVKWTSVVQQTFEEFLLQLGLCDFDLDRLVHLLRMTAPVVCIVLDGCREKGVDEGCLSQARFASNLERLLST